MTLKTSLLITGDASVAKAEVAALVSAVEKLGAGAKATAAPVAALDQAQRSAATSAREVATATATADQAQAAVAESAGIAAAAQAQLSAAQIEAAAGARGLAQALASAEAAQIDASASAREAAAVQAAATVGMANLAAAAGQLGTIMAALGASSDRAGAGADRAGAGTSAYAAQLARLRAELDPVGESQRRLAATTDLLDTALAKGDIDAGQYATALGRAAAAAGGTAGAQAALDAAMAQGTISAEQLAIGMKAAASATTAHGGASMQMGAAGLIADHVVRSFSDSIAAGQSPIRAATLEMGRVTEAMTLFAMQSGNAGGALGKFAAFMGGPFGIALQIGVALLTPLIGKLFEQGDAADSASKKTMELQDALRQYGSATDEVRKALDDYNDAQRRARENDSLSIDTNLRLADAQLKRAIATRQATQAQLSQAIATAQATSQQAQGQQRYGTRDGLTFQAGYANAAVAGLQAQVASEQGSIGTLEQTQRNLFISQAKKTAEDAVDPVKKLNDQYDRMRDTAIHAAAGNTALAKSLAGTLTGVEQRRTAAVDAERKSQRDAKRKPKKPKSQAGLERFGDTAGSRIADIIGQYNPDSNLAALEKTNKAIRGIDDLITDLGRRKPPGFEDLIASAENAKVTVREGIVAELTNAFEKPKTLAEQAGVAFAKLNVLEADAASQKYDGYKDVIAFVEQKKGVINDALIRPYEDYVKAQRDELAVMQLQAAGLDDQAAALKEIQALEKNGGPLTQDRKDAILATVEAMRAEQRQIDLNREHTQLYLDALGGIKTVVEDATQSFVKGDLGQLVKAPGKLLDVFTQLKGQDLFSNLFGGAFRDLQDQVNGLSPLKQASTAMASALATIAPHVETAGAALDAISPPTRTVTDALGTLAGQATAAARALGGIAQPGSTVANGPAGATSAPDDSATNGGTGDVVVTGSRVPKVSIDGDITRSLHSIAEIAGAKLPGSTLNAETLFASSIGKIATSITGLFTNSQNAESIGKAIGKFSGEALSGAATGTFVAGIGNAIGVHLDQSGSQLGGAVGGVLGSIKSITSALGPLGGAIAPILSIAGGLLGGLFHKVDYGTASVTSNDSKAVVSGNSAGDQSTAGSLAGQVQSGIAQVAQQLGGVLGQYSVAIGQFNGKYRVNDYATGASLNYNNFGSDTLHDFGKDGGDAAVSYAIAEAVKEGAVSGLSAAVQKAIGSSDDINKALQEALNVEQLETFIGGTAAALKKTFDTEQNTATARVALAQKYGLDVLATEKANAEERANLITSTLKAQVGSLQDLLTSMTSGDLFEGSASDRRSALMTQIAAAKTDAAAGKDGAADTLAQLYQQLLTTSKDAYGTAGGEYQADRTSVSTGAQSVIDSAVTRISAASGGTAADAAATQALAAGQSETNDLIAVSNARLAAIADLLGAPGTTATSVTTATTARSVSLT